MSHDLRDLLRLEAIVNGATKHQTDGIELSLDVVSITAGFFDLEAKDGQRCPSEPKTKVPTNCQQYDAPK
jgi:hypothetical protein